MEDIDSLENAKKGRGLVVASPAGLEPESGGDVSRKLLISMCEASKF